MNGIDEHDLAGLSDAERAALMEDEDLPDTGDLDTREAGPTGDFDYTVMSDLAARTLTPEQVGEHMERLKAQRAQIEEAYDSGESELTWAEYRAELRRIADAELAASSDLAEARLIHRSATQAANQEWQRQITDHRREAKRLGLDMDRNPELAQQWDRAVKFLGSDPENANRDMKWFLEEGLKMVAVRHGKIKPERDFGMPARDTSRTVDVPRLDDLRGMDLEKALARMSPEQAEAWLNS
jgi:hypothetical protein